LVSAGRDFTRPIFGAAPWMFLSLDLAPFNDLCVKVFAPGFEEKGKSRPPTRRALHGERSSMKLGEFASKCEPDPNSTLLTSFGTLDLVEALEDTGLFVPGDARSRVGHLDRDTRWIVKCSYINAAPSWRKFYRVTN
jgi:hypothetical protein